MTFIKENQAVIDLKNNTITLDGREYELENKISSLNKLEEELMNSTKIYTLSKFEKTITK